MCRPRGRRVGAIGDRPVETRSGARWPGRACRSGALGGLLMSFKIENRSFSDMIDIFLLVMRKTDATFYQFIRSKF